MHRKFIALILTAALCITGLSVLPARADQQGTVRAITGLAALALLGLAIHHARNKDDPPTVSSHVPPRPQPAPARFELPRKCLRDHRLHGGPRRLLGLQ